MIRKIGLLVATLAMALSFSVAPATASILITCNDDPPYAVFYGNESGTGGRFVVCHGSNYSNLGNLSSGSQTCLGSGYNGDWADCFTSFTTTGLNTSNLALCMYKDINYGGAKRGVIFDNSPGYGFTPLQWHQLWYDSGAGMNDNISSIRWVTSPATC